MNNELINIFFNVILKYGAIKENKNRGMCDNIDFY